MRRCKSANHQTGSILALTLFVLIPMVVLVQTAMTRSSGELRISERHAGKVEEFHLAEAAVDEAIRNIELVPWFTSPLLTPCAMNQSPSVQCGFIVTNDANDTKIIRGQGALGGNVGQTVQAVVYAPPGAGPFGGGPFKAGESINMGTGGLYDSYDSRLGDYGATIPSDLKYGTLNQSQAARPQTWNASLQTDGTSTSPPYAIQLGVNTTLFGNGICGVGCSNPDVAIDVGNGSTLYGSKMAASQALTLPPVPDRPITPGAIEIASCTPGVPIVVDVSTANISEINVGDDCEIHIVGEGVLHLNELYTGSDSVVWFKNNGAPGSRVQVRLADKLRIGYHNNIKIDPGHQVSMHVAGFVDVGNSTQINAAFERRPSQFHISVHGSGNVMLGHLGQFYGTIYAPESLVSLGDSKELFGAVAGNRVWNAQVPRIHYDEALEGYFWDPDGDGFLVKRPHLESWIYTAGTTYTYKVVCTELYRQGYVPHAWFAADVAYARTYIDEPTRVAYLAWGIPLAERMARSRFLTYLARPIGTAWAQHMAYVMGASQQDNFFGKLLNDLGVPFHRAVGRLLMRSPRFSFLLRD